MNGNTMHPLQAFLGPMAEYLQSAAIRKPAMQRDVADYMRRARLEQEQGQRSQQRFLREEEEYTERKGQKQRAKEFAERVRGRIDEGGKLKPGEAFEAETYGYDIPKWMVEGQGADLPDWLGRYEYQRQHGVGLFEPPSQRATADPVRSAAVRIWQDENRRRSQENRASRARPGMESFQEPMELDEALRQAYFLYGEETPEQYQELPGLTGELSMDLGMPGEAYAGMGMELPEQPLPTEFGQQQQPPMQGVGAVAPSALMMQNLAAQDPEAVQALQYLGIDESASPDDLQAVLQQVMTDPSLPDSPLKQRTIELLQDMIALSAGG